MILPLLYGCEFPRHMLREESRLIVLGNKVQREISGPMKNQVQREISGPMKNQVQREISGPMKNQVREGQRKLRIEKLNALLYSTIITI